MGKRTGNTIAILFFAMAFSAFAADNSRDYLNGDGYQYRYISRKQVEISTGQTITQVLTYIEFNDNLDYWLTVFANPKNEEISMHTGPGIETSFTEGEKVKVIWELITLHEAALNEAQYYYWSIVEIAGIDD